MKKLSAVLLTVGLFLQSATPAWSQVVRAVPTLGLPASVSGAAAVNPLVLPAGVSALGSASFLPSASVLSAAGTPLALPTAIPVAAAAARPVVPSAASAVRALSSVVTPAAALSANAPSDDGRRSFDGAGDTHSEPILSPAFEPPVVKAAEPVVEEAGEIEGDNVPQRPQLSFQPAAKSSLMAIEAGKSLYGSMKLVKNSPFSRDWWNAYSKGKEIDVVVRGENVFNRPTTITFAATKAIGKLTREDFEGTVPAHMLKAGVVALRKQLMSNLEENRRRWSPEQPPVGPESKVRIVKFESYLDLFRKVNGKDAIPQAEAVVERAPLKVKPEGALKPLSFLLPRAVYLDMDMFDGPISKELLSDMAKLQRTGVYFVGFTRKSYAEAGSMKDKLVKQLSAYQMSILMPIRFMMVTDDGAVISELPRGGSPEAVDVLAFTLAEQELLRDAAKKAAEQVGISPRGLEEVRQPPLVQRENHFGDQKEIPLGPDPRVRFEVRLPKSLSEKSLGVWLRAFDTALKAQGVKVVTKVVTHPDGRKSFVASRTTLEGSMERLGAALGEKFGLYLNPGDMLVLSDDPSIRAQHPKTIDFAGITGLKGAEMAENALGLLLGEHRDNRPGDLSGSASRIASFSYNKQRYLSEALIKMDGEEQNINFFSGHVVHAAQDWLIYELQNGRTPTKDEFVAHLSRKWNEGMREFKAVGMPAAHLSDSWLKASSTRAESMYEIVNKIHAAGETLIGTEIPNFFMLKDFQRKSGELKRRYILHTIFDFIALRPDPKRPGHATLVIYDFKTGPAKTRPKLNKDVQVLTYALFAHEKWVGQKFPAPYLAGNQAYTIDDVSVEFIYSRKVQPTDVNRWSLDGARKKNIGALNRIHAAETKLFDAGPAKPKAKKAKPAKAKKGAKTAPKKSPKRS